ncbi:hypothetical protein [Brasilonema bromeliae]|uniref:Uncharacterized protein n=1 Tax=Brasilonema bromeliae SPC951 TaxID=385972 RepID=A0ABX1P2Z5_9CYAN|nr:hypothetical protein [Brasilonema bromeliae]NMG18704.1 hypothetical protein [Brasilonema bromeliae SPC951]
MKNRRQRVSRSTIRKYSAELEQRLREQSKLERLEKLSEFRDWLIHGLLVLLLILGGVFFSLVDRVFDLLYCKILQLFPFFSCSGDTIVRATRKDPIYVLLMYFLIYFIFIVVFKLYVEDKKKRSQNTHTNSVCNEYDDYDTDDDYDHDR